MATAHCGTGLPHRVTQRGGGRQGVPVVERARRAWLTRLAPSHDAPPREAHRLDDQAPCAGGDPLKPRRLLLRLLQGNLKNVAFADMVRLVEAFGFHETRVAGSHHIFSHPHVPELANLQDVRGEAKPYQIRQVLRLVERYNLTLEDDA